MTAVYKLNGVTLDPANVYLHWDDEEGFEGAMAADGTGSFGSVTIHDLPGTLDVRGWMPFTIDETDCTSAPRLVTAWIWERNYSRDGDEQVGASRSITAQLLDPNALLSLRVIDGSDGNRPAENVTQRLTWLLGSAYLSGLVADHGYVNGGTSALDAENLIGRYPADVMASIAALGITDQVFFAFYDQVATAIGLYFDSATATTYTSTISISNVKGDLSSTCVFPQDAVLNRNPAEVYSDLRYVTKAGVFKRFNATTRSTFFPSPLGKRGANIENDRDGSSATSIRHGDNWLTVHSVERDTITVTIRVTSAQAGLIAAGMAMNVKFSHFPGYTTTTAMRIERATFRHANRRKTLYDFTLTLTNRGLSSGIPAGGGDPGDLPHPPVGDATPDEIKAAYNNITLDNIPSDGKLILVGQAIRGVGAPNFSGFPGTYTLIHTNAPSGGGIGFSIGWRLASGETTALYAGGAGSQNVVAVYPVGTTIGATAFSDSVTGTSVNFGGSVAAAASSVVWGFACNTYFFGETFTPAGSGETVVWNHMDASANPPGFLANYKLGSVPGNATLANSADWGGVTVEVVASTSDNPPATGQWQYGEVVTIAGTTGTTHFPFAAGSLRVRVDGVLISTASYTETDPATGTFDLSWTKDADEVVTVDYQGL